MNNTPMFSIIVPVYKVEKYLCQCVDSLLTQDFDDYEIILVDDGSPDSCPQICDEYASRNERVRVVHKPNGGLSDARNEGVKVSKGKYLTFVDSDDFWIGTEVLSGVSQIINKFHPDIVVSDFIKYYTDSKKYLYPSITCDTALNGKSKIEVLEYLYFCHADMKISAWQKFAERELLTRNPFTKGLLSEDIDWTLKIYPSARSICMYGKPYYCYRQMREGSISTTASTRSFNSILSIIDNWEKTILQLAIPREEKNIYLGYLAYQLSILMLMANKLPKKDRPDALRLIRGKLNLFSYPKNDKTKLVKALIRIIGLKNTSRVLQILQTMRYKLSKS